MPSAAARIGLPSGAPMSRARCRPPLPEPYPRHRIPSRTGHRSPLGGLPPAAFTQFSGALPMRSFDALIRVPRPSRAARASGVEGADRTRRTCPSATPVTATAASRTKRARLRGTVRASRAGLRSTCQTCEYDELVRPRFLPLCLALVSAPAAADPALVVTLSAPAHAVVGGRAELGISVEARGGHVLHEIAPLFVDLEGPVGLGLARRRLERADSLRFDAPAAVFRVVLRPTAAGTHAVSARVRAWVCRGPAGGDARCRVVETVRVARIEVAPAP